MKKMKDSGIEWIGIIPEQWELISHKYVMNKSKELCPNYNNEPILSLTKGGVIKRDLDNPSGKMPTTFDGYQHVFPGNLLLCLFDIDVTPRCVGLINDYGLTSPAYSRFVVNEGYHASYYNLLLEMIDDAKAFLHLSKNLRYSLTETDFGVIKTVAPPLHEQMRIAKYIERKKREIDSIIERTKESIEEYKIYKQSLIAETVTKGLNQEAKMKDSGIEWIGEIPEHWTTMKIKHLLSSITNKNVYDSNYIGLENVEKETGRYVDVSEKTTLGGDTLSYEPDNLLFGKLRPYLAKVYKTQTQGCCSSEFLVLEVIDGDTDFYFYRLLSGDFIRIVNSSTYGTKMPRASWDFIKELRIPVPPVNEQVKIKEFLSTKSDSINEFIDSKMRLISELEVYKKSLIYEVVTGKKEVRGVEAS